MTHMDRYLSNVVLYNQLQFVVELNLLYDKLNTVLLGGVPANTLLKAKGVDVQNSLVAKGEDFSEFLNMLF